MAVVTIHQRRQWHPTPVLLPGKYHGQRSVAGCSPWGREESDTTERLPFRFSLSHIGEGNGNPLQCSCLENPRVGGAWWAAVYGVAQSRRRLKRLSSSSSSSSSRSKAARRWLLNEAVGGQGCLAGSLTRRLFLGLLGLPHNMAGGCKTKCFQNREMRAVPL